MVKIGSIEKNYILVDQLIEQLIPVDNFILNFHKISSYVPKIDHIGQKLKKANFPKISCSISWFWSIIFSQNLTLYHPQWSIFGQKADLDHFVSSEGGPPI